MFGFKSDRKDDSKAATGLFASLRQRLSKTRENLSSGLGNLLLGKKQIDADLLEQLEDQLLMADVGMQATQKITSQLTESLKRRQLGDSESLIGALKRIMSELLAPCALPLQIDPGKKPFVILMVGVNGAGKTTTVGKLAQQFKNQGLKVMLAAGDTFRAAAVEQLQAWGERLDVPVIRQGQGADSASVIFDALQSALESRYQDESFVDVLPGGSHPETRSVRGANQCRIAVHKPQDGDTVVVLSVIDNLVKGAAGQAVQNMNIMFGLNETSGLNNPALLP